MPAPLGTRLKRAWEQIIGQGGSEFEAAEQNRFFFDWATNCLSADEEILKSIRLMRARGRDLVRNNGNAKHFVQQLNIGVLGPHGMDLQCQYRNEKGELVDEVNSLIEDRFWAWARRPVTTDRRWNLLESSRLHLKTVAAEGETFVRKVRGFPHNEFGFALESIDADMLDEQYNVAAGTHSPEIRMGVEVDEWGGPLAFHFWPRPPGIGQVPRDARKRVPADEVIHPFDPLRVNQTRGITWFHPVIRAMRHRGAYSEAELIAARFGAAKIFTIEQKDGGPGLPKVNAGAAQKKDAKTPSMMEVEPGSGFRLGPGETANMLDAKHPTTQYGDFIKQILREEANGLEIDYTSYANDPTGVSFATSRAFIIAVRDFYKMKQQWWGPAYYQEIFEGWLQWSILTGQLRLPRQYPADWRLYRDGLWVPRAYDWVDPYKDVQAKVLAIQWGLESRTRVAAESGADFSEIAEDLEAEKQTAEEKGIVIEAPLPAANAADAQSGTGDGTSTTGGN